jgi:sarcosine oxidase
MKVFDVAVVGLGAMGSAAAYHLALRGQRVVAFDRFEPGHDRGSSHGESRMIRLAYFEHPSYVPFARRAYANWRALEHRSGKNLLTVTGILEAGPPNSSVVAGALAASRLHQLDHDVMDAEQINRRFPAFRLPSDWSGVLQPDGGFLRPERAIRLHCAMARTMDADLRTGIRVTGIELRKSSVIVSTDDGTFVEAGAVVVATGAWIPELVPELKPHLKLTRQTFGWLTPCKPELFRVGNFPVFIIQTEDNIGYGFPDIDGKGVKVGLHKPGNILAHADAAGRRNIEQNDYTKIYRCLERFMSGSTGNLQHLQTCIYTLTPDEDFVIDHHPSDRRIVIASPCSGHGFKFASVIGEVLADLAVDGSTKHDIHRFRLGRLLKRSKVTGSEQIPSDATL